MEFSKEKADEIIKMLKEADANDEYLLILLTGLPCSGKSTIANFVREEYGAFDMSIELVSFRPGNENLAIVQPADVESKDMRKIFEIIMMLEVNFAGYKCRRPHHGEELIKPFHILMIIDKMKQYEAILNYEKTRLLNGETLEGYFYPNSKPPKSRLRTIVLEKNYQQKLPRSRF